MYPWIKTRLIETGFFSTGTADDQPDYVIGKFHVFFMFLEETEEMLSRLRLDDEAIDAIIARSGIFSTSLIPTPIDRVAWLVSGLNP